MSLDSAKCEALLTIFTDAEMKLRAALIEGPVNVPYIETLEKLWQGKYELSEVCRDITPDQPMP